MKTRRNSSVFQLSLFPLWRTCTRCRQDKSVDDFVAAGQKTGRCSTCRKEHYIEKHREITTRCNRRIKATVMAAYGSCCAYCGETDLARLEIDHVEGDGAKQRAWMRANGMSLASGPQFYYWLRRNGYPAGFQVLCSQCNWAKGNMPDAVFRAWIRDMAERMGNN